MERKSELTKALLGEKFKELVAKKGFEKLTIKIITDAAGVIRPTFCGKTYLKKSQNLWSKNM